jgi:hypothetical protein
LAEWPVHLSWSELSQEGPVKVMEEERLCSTVRLYSAKLDVWLS